ncbi:MAG: helix-turn-helix transcriptional regulator [Rhodobacteraceae bacterium]|nr:helix-turn-helix transcriptional regulator [Paracoccaceae bacterium]
MKTFTETLDEHIKATPDLTEAGLARSVGLDKSTIRQMIKFGRQPGVENALKICAALGTTIEDFMGGDRPALEAQFLELAAQLTDAERQVLEASLKAMIESRNRVPE